MPRTEGSVIKQAIGQATKKKMAVVANSHSFKINPELVITTVIATTIVTTTVTTT